MEINREYAVASTVDLCDNAIKSSDEGIFAGETASVKPEVAIEADPLFNSTAELDVQQQKKKKKKSQAEIDREIVDEFYNKQSHLSFKKLWNRFHYGVHNYAYKFIGDWERANDIVQETFQKAWEKRETYNPKKSVYSTWLYTICRNIALSQLQQNAKDKFVDADVNDVFRTSPGSFDEKFSSDDESYYVTTDSGEIVRNNYEGITQKMYDVSIGVLEKMDSLFVEIMKLRNLKNMTLKQISQKLNLTESRVKNIYYKNKEALRAKMISEHRELYDTYKEAIHDKTDKDVMIL